MSILGHDPKHVKPLGPTDPGRMPVLVMETDEPHVHVHGLVLAPRRMTVAMAKEEITKAFAEVRKADPDEWNYGQLEKLLTDRGFLYLSVGIWEEYADGYPLEEARR